MNKFVLPLALIVALAFGSTSSKNNNYESLLSDTDTENSSSHQKSKNKYLPSDEYDVEDNVSTMPKKLESALSKKLMVLEAEQLGKIKKNSSYKDGPNYIESSVFETLSNVVVNPQDVKTLDLHGFNLNQPLVGVVSEIIPYLNNLEEMDLTNNPHLNDLGSTLKYLGKHITPGKPDSLSWYADNLRESIIKLKKSNHAFNSLKIDYTGLGNLDAVEFFIKACKSSEFNEFQFTMFDKSNHLNQTQLNKLSTLANKNNVKLSLIN
jgi:hypothetical protein